MQLNFDDCQIDTEAFVLRRAGEICHLEPKVFDLIVHFVCHPNQVFSHDELIEAVWQGRFVSESTVSTCVKNARKALGDSGNVQRYIKTVRGRGFRFDAEVIQSSADIPKPTKPANEGPTPALLIQPFRAQGDNAGVCQLAEVLGNGLGRVLTRIPLLRISVPPAAGYRNSIEPSVRELHETRGIDFVIEGALRNVADQYRVDVHLLDARSGFQLWNEQIDVRGPLEHALDEAPISVIAKLEPQLHKAIYATVTSVEHEGGARQLFLEAASVMVLNGWGHEAFTQAAVLLRRSCELEPDFALAHAYLALVMGFGDRVGLMADREQAKAESEAAAARALALDSLDSTVLGYAGCALADIGQSERALPILESAVEISASNAQAWAALGSLHVLAGRTDKGIEDLQHGIAISPLDSRLCIWGTILTMGLLQADRLDEAVQEGQLACRRDPRCYLPRVALAGAHLMRSDKDEAKTSLQEAVRLKPDLNQTQIQSIVGRKLSIGLRRINR